MRIDTLLIFSIFTKYTTKKCIIYIYLISYHKNPCSKNKQVYMLYIDFIFENTQVYISYVEKYEHQLDLVINKITAKQ